MRQRLSLITALLAVLSFQAPAQVDTRVHIFDSNVKSLKVAPENNQYLPPIILLDGKERININFDYLDYDVHYLRYSVTHCNANWQPSVLVESEYLDGFNYADVNDYAQSEATFTHYYNYNIAIPNDDMHLLKSGNYLLSVYEQDDSEKILFQTRFSVCEGTVSVFAEVSSRTDIEFNNRYQQVGFEVRYKPNQIRDPYNELTAVVTQNSRDDNAVTVTQPLMVGTDHVTYDHQHSLIFPAGNEFRRMETVNIHSINMGVAQIQYFEPFYHATLFTDEPRSEQSYLYDQTQFGRFTIRNAEAYNSHTEADYVVTHFTLGTDQQYTGGNFYLFGEFTQGLPLQQTLMKWDGRNGYYYNDMLLKQGAYNYLYLWLPDGAEVGQTSLAEGDYYETINEYLVKIYDRPMGERYDHLIGFGKAYGGK